MPTGAIAYVVAGLVALALLVGAHEIGFRRASAVGKAIIAQYQAEAKAEVEKARAEAKTVETKVVIEYRDRVKVIREVGPEVVREIEIIRKSGCVLPPEWRLLHDSATGSQAPEAGSSADPATDVDCATALETVRENYARARENAAQLEALQQWVGSVTQ